LDYRFPVDALVQRFKFSRNLACGDALGRELAGAVSSSSGASPRPCTIVPVPLHRSRHVSRTFNQSEVLARYVGKRMEIPVNSLLLSRVRRTRAQSGLDAKSRRKNTRGAFHCHYRRARGIRHAALVDDVMTTGATLDACTRELKRAGIREISIWVVARAPPP
jgi:ComF family protein